MGSLRLTVEGSVRVMQIARTAYQIDIEKPGVRLSRLTAGFFIALRARLFAWYGTILPERHSTSTRTRRTVY